MSKFFIAAIAPLLFAAASAGAEPASNIQTTTAFVHAEMALAAKNLHDAREHFHHVINCIADRKNGAPFDAKFADPCDGMGTDSGALHDEAKTDADKRRLERALDVAQRGAATKSTDSAHVYAEWLASVLQPEPR